MTNTPKLRFKEFSEDWKWERAENIFSSITDKKHNGDLLVLSATQDRGVIPRNEIGIDIKYEQENLSSYKKVKYNDFIISLRSFQGGIEHSMYEGLVSPAYTIFNFKNESLFNHNFFAIRFKSQNFINRLNTLTYGIRDGKAISFTDFSSMRLAYPEKDEQEKIASFFSLIDKKIELQTEKVEELKKYKKGIMQKIFSEELRFKDENGNEYPDWEKQSLRKILKEVSEKTTVVNQYEVISSTNNGLYLQKDYFNREIASKDNVGYKILRRNQVVLSPQNLWMGNINLNNKYDIGMVSPSYKIFNIKEEFDFRYIGYTLRTERAFYEYKQASEQGASIVRRNLNMDLFYDISINMPCKAEQCKISDLIGKIDLKIDKEEEKLQSLKQHKKGLLQQMFI